MNTLLMCMDWAVGKCSKLLLWTQWKPRNTQKQNLNFFLKRPVAIIIIDYFTDVLFLLSISVIILEGKILSLYFASLRA